VYRGFDIGTAKPSAADRRRVPHHLLDVADPHERFTVARFQTLAEAAVSDIWRRGRWPLLVGGTGLWIRSVTEGYRFHPVLQAGWEDTVARWERDWGLGALRRQLRLVDPDSFRHIAATDARRIRHALATFMGTGRRLVRQADRRRPSLKVAVTRSRSTLSDRIAARAAEQMADGLLDEALAHLRAGVSPRAQPFQALGYREAAFWARGLLADGEVLPLIIRHTRQYAKRQLTWFRHEPGVRWLDLDTLDEDAVLDRLVEWTRAFSDKTLADRS
jgi:tRNA dimethylallyltransferase